MASLVYRSLSGMAPAYLAADCQLSSEDYGQLPFADSRTCVIWRTYNNCGDRYFATASPKLWNNLPVGFRQNGCSLNTGLEHYIP